MNIFKKLYLYFKWRFSKTSIGHESEDNEILCSLSIEITKDGKYNIICDWPNFDNETSGSSLENAAKYYAMMIRTISCGAMEVDILDTLKNCDKNNPYNILFVHNVLIELININKQSYDINQELHKPLILPTNVFKQ